MLGLAGIFCGKKWGIFAGTDVGCAGRFWCHYSWAPPLGPVDARRVPLHAMSNPWFYSLIYNGVYMLPNMLLALASRAPSIRR